MYCKKCGSRLPDRASFCMNCGTPLKVSAPNKSPNADNWLVGGVIAAAIVVVIICILAMIPAKTPEKTASVSINPSSGSTTKFILPQAPAPTTAAPEPSAPTQPQPQNTKPETGWYTENGVRYYYLNGVMMTGLQEIRGQLYYFYEDGALAINTTVKYNGNILEAGNDGRITAITYAKIKGYWSDSVYKFKDGHSAYLLELETPVTNCDRTGIYIEASGQRGASVSSEWKIYVRSRGNWTLLDEVYYTEPSRTFEFKFTTPVEFDAIAAYPTARGSYTYNFDYYLVDTHMYY